jgi:23S rRNA pseudouridine2605 synthase
MRINKFVAASTGLSRRVADAAIKAGEVRVNNQPATAGYDVQPADLVTMKGKQLAPIAEQTIVLHKPAGYVTSRNGQGSRTIYDLLPPELHQLKPVGRLDKDSSGLLLLTNNGELAQQLTHPSHRKMKCYEVTLDTPLTLAHREQITEKGVRLDDGPSTFGLQWLRKNKDEKNDGLQWLATMYEGRNRQIRRTFASLGYTVTRLHRTRFGDYTLGDLGPGRYYDIAAADLSKPTHKSY